MSSGILDLTGKPHYVKLGGGKGKYIQTPHLHPFEYNTDKAGKIHKDLVKNKTRSANINDMNEALYNHLKNNFRLQNFINRDFFN